MSQTSSHLTFFFQLEPMCSEVVELLNPFSLRLSISHKGAGPRCATPPSGGGAKNLIYCFIFAISSVFSVLPLNLTTFSLTSPPQKMPISSSKFALLILMIAAICIIVSSATPAETCLRRLTKFCKNVVNPEDCKMTTAVQTFSELSGEGVGSRHENQGLRCSWRDPNGSDGLGS